MPDLRLKYTKSNFSWASAPDPTRELRALQSSPDLLAGFRGLLIRGGEGKRGSGGSCSLLVSMDLHP